MLRDLQQALQHVQDASRVWLCLDYDGTLADFAPTPDTILPDPQVIELLTQLAAQPGIQPAVISGRRLAHLRQLLPIPGIWLAGTYGIEMLSPQGELIERLDYAGVRPYLEQIKPRWRGLTENEQGFYLEDKGWSLALHARFADDQQAQEVLEAAARVLQDMPTAAQFELLGGHKFLEICPRLAHKGQALAYLFARQPLPDALPVYIGDDDKDEKAFQIVNANGGLSIVVAAVPRSSAAFYRLASPQEVRAWLTELIS